MNEALPRLPKRIETERLVLRRFGYGDVEDAFAYGQDSEWARYLDVRQPCERADAEK